MRFKTKFLKSDYKKRLIAKETEIKKITQISLFKNKIIPLSVRQTILSDSNNEFNSVKKTQIRNRCIITGRGRGNLTNFGFSRLVFRKQSDNGLIPGITTQE